jgi:hypothetical protein
VNLNQIQLLGKRFWWKKLDICPNCQSRRVWGHGFTLRYFQGFSEGLWIKRWRCPDCSGVHTARPHEYPVGSQYPIRTRLESVLARIEGRRFFRTVPRQTQQYWWKAFKFQSRQHENWPSLNDFYDEQITSGIKPISFRLKYRAIPSCNGPPYLNLAVTTARN